MLEGLFLVHVVDLRRSEPPVAPVKQPGLRVVEGVVAGAVLEEVVELGVGGVGGAGGVLEDLDLVGVLRGVLHAVGDFWAWLPQVKGKGDSS